MSVWTRQELHENIALWKRAYRAVINGKSYSIGSRSLTYQDLDKIEAQLDKLQAQLDALEGKPTGLGFISVGMSR